jgi:excisionase family DNA binding protein
MGKPDNMLTVREAADLLNVSKMTMYRRIHTGEFTTVTDYKGMTHVPKAEVDQVLAELREKGWGND